MDLKTERFPRNKTQTKLTANVLKQAPNTRKVKKNSDFNLWDGKKFAHIFVATPFFKETD